jgi:predicted metal-dependent hydrolase
MRMAPLYPLALIPSLFRERRGRAHGLGGPPPFNLGAIREPIDEERDRVEKRLHRFEKQNSDTKQSDRKSWWLEMRIAVLTARRAVSDRPSAPAARTNVEASKSLGRKKQQKFLEQVNARLAELYNGG